MKLTLTLEATGAGVQAQLVEEWEESGRLSRMAPMLRLFDTDDEALAWGRAMARRRGLKQLFLDDHRR